MNENLKLKFYISNKVMLFCVGISAFGFAWIVCYHIAWWQHHLLSSRILWSSYAVIIVCCGRMLWSSYLVIFVCIIYVVIIVCCDHRMLWSSSAVIIVSCDLRMYHQCCDHRMYHHMFSNCILSQRVCCQITSCYIVNVFEMSLSDTNFCPK